MEFKGTKGEWGFEEWLGYYRVHISSETMCDIITNGVCDVEIEANAKLISAAPDLLEALQNCVAALELYNVTPITRDHAIKAIEKALK